MRPCTCHPLDNPPFPCAMKYALSDCRAAEIDRLNKWADGMSDAALKERALADAYQKELKGRIEQLESQLANARNEAMDICRDTRVVSGLDEKLMAFNDGCEACEMAIYKSSGALKEKDDIKLAQTTNEPVITQAQWDNACAGLGTKP